MLSALATDFAALDDIEAVVLLGADSPDVRLPGCHVVPVHRAGEDLAALERWSRQADWTVVIAPEFDELLETRLELVASCGGRALASPLQLVALAADKHRTAEHLAAAGIAAPRGIFTPSPLTGEGWGEGGNQVGLTTCNWSPTSPFFPPLTPVRLSSPKSDPSPARGEGRRTEPRNPLPADFPYPAVFKPRFGAGSQDIWFIPDAAIAAQMRGMLDRPGRLEQFCPGAAASVAILCGPAARLPLLPCRQRLSADGRFRYLGGRCPLDVALAHRAERLAVQAVGTLNKPLGYLGVDLVLGDDPRGTDDRVIEINPRLTTSYVGLRTMSAVNLAGAMLSVAEGRPARLSWLDREVEFDGTGNVREVSRPGSLMH